LNRSRLENCSFKNANLVSTTAYDAVLGNCDFHHADIKSFMFRNTQFYKCGFSGHKNMSILEGDYKVIDADIFEDFDGSKE
jgi:uncharacterized protein YjbI with pentapeptide repeats